jgi:hypothetical protein
MQVINAKYWCMKSPVGINENQNYTVLLFNRKTFIFMQAQFLFKDDRILIRLNKEIKENSAPRSGAYLKMNLASQSGFVIDSNKSIFLSLKFENEILESDDQINLCNIIIRI